MLCDSTDLRFLEESGSQRQMSRRWGTGVGRGGELVFNGDRVSVLQNQELWGWIVVMAAQPCECA